MRSAVQQRLLGCLIGSSMLGWASLNNRVDNEPCRMRLVPCHQVHGIRNQDSDGDGMLCLVMRSRCIRWPHAGQVENYHGALLFLHRNKYRYRPIFRPAWHCSRHLVHVRPQSAPAFTYLERHRSWPWPALAYRQHVQTWPIRAHIVNTCIAGRGQDCSANDFFTPCRLEHIDALHSQVTLGSRPCLHMDACN